MRKDSIFNAIVALVAIDLLADIMFIYALLGEGQEQENQPSYTDTHPLVGRRYVVKDESYAYDRESGVPVSGLVGKEYIIVDNPFVEQNRLMVTIFSTDSERDYNVLFQENSIVEE